MKTLRLLAFLAILIAPGLSRAVTTSTPPGCPISGAPCDIPVYPFGSPYPINKLVTGSDGNIYRSVVSTNVADPASATECGTAWLPVMIFVNKTVNINAAGSAQCSDFPTAMAFLSKSVIASNATVTLKAADGTYTFPAASISLNHAFGRQIQIIGNTTTPANVTFNFPGINVPASILNHALFEITNGNGFSLIDGIAFVGPGCGGVAPSCTNSYLNSGFVLFQGSGANGTVGPHVTFSAGYYGVNGREGARFVADGVDCSGGGDGCLWAYGASMQAFGAKAHDAVNINAGAGFLCDNFSYCEIDGSYGYSNQRCLALFNGSAARINGSSFGGLTCGKDAGGTLHQNAVASVALNNTPYFNIEGLGNFFDAVTLYFHCSNYMQGGNFIDSTGGTQDCTLSNASVTNSLIGNGGFMGGIFFNSSGRKAFSSSPNSAPNTDAQLGIYTFPNGNTSREISFGVNSLMCCFVGLDSSWNQVGSSSGVITQKTQAAAGTYNWNWPTTAGTTGYFLTSDGGGAGGGMTWTPPPTAGSGAEQTISFQPGLITAVTNTKGVFGKFVKASTVDNIIASAILFTCVSNPTITLYECGTDASCATTPTTIGTATVTAAGAAVTGTVSNAAITAGDFVAWAISSGTCTSLDISANAQVHAN